MRNPCWGNCFFYNQWMMQFDKLKMPGVEHGFTLRENPPWPGIGEAVAALNRQGLSCREVVQVTQVHGAEVLRVDDVGDVTMEREADGLVTGRPGVTLVVRVADCGPIYLVDRRLRAVGLLHSGRKGTEADILSTGVGLMKQEFGCAAADILGFLGPCIRPPHYELDIPAALARQAAAAGIQWADCGLNTGTDSKRFYSYRMEKGSTGRHFAAIRLG